MERKSDEEGFFSIGGAVWQKRHPQGLRDAEDGGWKS